MPTVMKSSSWQDRLYMLFVTVFLWLAFLVILIPLIYIVSSSFSSPEAIGNGRVYLFPVDFSLKGYESVFMSAQIFLGFRNSIFYTIAGTAINIVVTMLAAYPLSRKDLRVRNFVMFVFSFTMLFSGGLIPGYMLVRNLRMLDTVWAMLIPGAMSVYNMIIARTYISTSIPDELYESASLDGCSDPRYLWSIVMPLCKPIIAVLVLWYAVGHWNSYFNAMIYLRSNHLVPLQIVLRNILILQNFDMVEMVDVKKQMEKEYLRNLYQYSLIVVASVPVMLLYPFVQKYFVKGIMLGSIKG